MQRRQMIAAAGAAAGLGLTSTAQAGAIIGKPAPKFTLTTFDHKRIKLADLAGKVIVLNYWAIWCGPCKAELPMIDAYVRDHGKGDLKVFAVTVDETVSDRELQPLADVLSFPLIARLDSFSYGKIDGAVPTNYIIGRDGILRYAKAASFTYATFNAVVAPLLAESAPPSIEPSGRRG